MANTSVIFEGPYPRKDGKGNNPAAAVIVTVYGTKAYTSRVTADALVRLIDQMENTTEGQKWYSQYVIPLKKTTRQ